MTKVVHVLYVVEQDEDGAGCASAQLRPDMPSGDLPDDAAASSPVSTGDLARFADSFSDLADPDVMSQAWDRL